MLNFGQDDNIMLFEADATVDLDDRQLVLGLYSGIALGAPPDLEEGQFRRRMRGGNFIGRNRRRLRP